MSVCRPLVVAEPGIDRAGREDQVIVGDVRQMGDLNDLPVLVDARDLPHQGPDPLHVGEHTAHRNRDVGRSQGRGRDLIEQGLKQVVVRLVDDRDEGRRDREAANERQAAEAGADDYDAGQVR